jgi:glutamate/tyrosine decarboxylase-like PLP-dependent enzyme
MEPLPDGPTPVSQLLAQLRSHVIAEMTHNDHPRNFAFVPGPSNFVGAMADALASAINIFCGAWIGPSGAAQIELLTIEWLRQLFAFPEQAGGLFVSGGSMANLTGLAVARHAMLANNATNAAIYFSDQTHSSVAKGLKILGFSQYQLRKLQSGPDLRLSMAQLRQKVAADRLQGMVPFCVVANAGTTNSGAVDPLNEIADFCAAEGLWMHVDGAYGASAALCEQGRAVLDGLNRADSLSIDPHKWLFQPYEIGCVLILRQQHLKDTFKVSAEYLKIIEESAEQPNFSDYGVQLTRGFRALKLWMSLKVFGAEAFRLAVDWGIELAEMAETVLRRMPMWEVTSPAWIGIVSFRYFRSDALSPEEEDEINQAIVDKMTEDGFAFVSTTILKGRKVIRMCIINPRTTEEDILLTIERMTRHGDAFAARCIAEDEAV